MTKDTNEGVTGKTVPGRPWRELYDKKERAFREKKSQDYAKSKGFNIKRDKGGSGFSFSMHKKIKGFEEEADMGKTNIDEAEGIKTVSTKGYSGSKPTKPSNRPGTKGFVNYKAGKPAGEADQKVLDYHRGEAAKEGKVVQLRYRGPRSHAGRQTYNPGASQTRGAATGAAVYYKNKSELGGRQRDAARKARVAARNEEYDIEYVDQLDELKASTLQSYAGKSEHQAKAFARRALGKGASDEEKKKLWSKFGKRTHGVTQAQDRAKYGKMSVKTPVTAPGPESPGYHTRKYRAEETEEQLDELKKSTLQSYAGKSSKQASGLASKALGKGASEEKGKLWRKFGKRTHGVVQAKDRSKYGQMSVKTPVTAPGPESPGYHTRKYRAEETEGYEMNEEDYENENQEPVTELSDLVVHAIDQRPLEFQQTFADLMQQRIEDAVHGAKLEIAAGFVANTEPIDVDFDDPDTEEDDDWDGTEYEEEEEDLTPGDPEEA